MTTPATPPISMADVRAEFGGTVGVTKLSDYVRGGSFVPNITGNSGVPTAVPITLSQLCNASKAPSASASPTSVSGTGVAPATVTSGSTTCTASGGFAGYTYSWTFVSGTALTVNTATSASTTFSHHFVTTGTVTAVYKCVITDSKGNTASSNNVSVSLDA